MQYANIMVALGGDVRNTVPKYAVSAAEIGTLMAIHGGDAIFDVEYVGDDLARNENGAPKSNRQIREELRLIYGGARDNNGNSIFEMLYPGAAARVFDNINELDIKDQFFKAVAHAPMPVAQVEEVDELEAEECEPKAAKGKSAKAKTAKKPAKVVKEEVAPVVEVDDLDDIGADDTDVLD